MSKGCRTPNTSDGAPSDLGEDAAAEASGARGIEIRLFRRDSQYLAADYGGSSVICLEDRTIAPDEVAD